MSFSQAAGIDMQIDEREGLLSDLRWTIDSAGNLDGSVAVVPFQVDSSDDDDRFSALNLRIGR